MRARRVVPVVLLLLLVAATSATWLSWALLRPGPDREVELQVVAGTPTQQVLEMLNHHDLLPSPIAGRLYLATLGRGRSPRWGSYRVPAGSRPVDVLERLLEGQVEMVSVTLIEGSTADEVVERLVASGIGSPADWQPLLQRVDWISDLAPGAPSLEGFLFPDTYRFAVGTSPASAARHLVDRFRQVWTRESAAAGGAWTSPLQIVTLASLVEAETSLDEERARIAGVFHNRLQRGMLLQCDPTVVFALKRRGEWHGRLLRVHWQVDDPYNTYRYPGLPPGPINSPGQAALAAALEPEQHHYLYFVARPQGGHTFSRTLSEHNRATARLLRSRR
jgi:UPF0755 protein